MIIAVLGEIRDLMVQLRGGVTESELNEFMLGSATFQLDLPDDSLIHPPEAS